MKQWREKIESKKEEANEVAKQIKEQPKVELISTKRSKTEPKLKTKTKTETNPKCRTRTKTSKRT
jgi:hypothetical protein